MADGDTNRLTFTEGAEAYAASRPTYPQELFEFLASVCRDCERALDVGTGNGQTALALVELFREVVATDSSAEQLAAATPHPRVKYLQMDAETLDFPAGHFDLVTVATALHWFNLDHFYPRVHEILRPEGVFAVWGYGFFTIEPKLDRLIREVLLEPVDPYWAPANRLIAEGYRSIPFPFEEIETPSFSMSLDWTVDQLVGFVGTWSAVKRYERESGRGILAEFKRALEEVWPEGERKRVEMPLALRVGLNG